MHLKIIKKEKGLLHPLVGGLICYEITGSECFGVYLKLIRNMCVYPKALEVLSIWFVRALFISENIEEIRAKISAFPLFRGDISSFSFMILTCVSARKYLHFVWGFRNNIEKIG